MSGLIKKSARTVIERVETKNVMMPTKNSLNLNLVKGKVKTNPQGVSNIISAASVTNYLTHQTDQKRNIAVMNGYAIVVKNMFWVNIFVI